MSVEPKMKIVPRNPTAFPCNSNHMKLKNTGSERGSEGDKASGLCEGKPADHVNAQAQVSLSNIYNVANNLPAE